MPTLASGETCTVVVIFSPQADGSFSATLIVSSDDPTAPTVQAVLTGIGQLNPFISGGGCALAAGTASRQFPMSILLGIPFLLVAREKYRRG